MEGENAKRPYIKHDVLYIQSWLPTAKVRRICGSKGKTLSGIQKSRAITLCHSVLDPKYPHSYTTDADKINTADSGEHPY